MEFQIDGVTYRVGKIDARSQFHIVRRLAPILGQLAPAFQGKASLQATTAPAEGEEKKEKAREAILDVLPHIADAIASLSDADADYVIFGLLKVITRKQDQGLGWGPVATDGYQLMYMDISMPTMLKLAAKSLQFNMSGFFSALPSDLKEAVLKANGQ